MMGAGWKFHLGFLGLETLVAVSGAEVSESPAKYGR